MTELAGLDRERIRELFDLRRRRVVEGGVYMDDPYPTLKRLRQEGPLHEGVVHELLGYDKPAY